MSAVAVARSDSVSARRPAEIRAAGQSAADVDPGTVELLRAALATAARENAALRLEIARLRTWERGPAASERGPVRHVSPIGSTNRAAWIRAMLSDPRSRNP